MAVGVLLDDGEGFGVVVVAEAAASASTAWRGAWVVGVFLVGSRGVGWRRRAITGSRLGMRL